MATKRLRIPSHVATPHEINDADWNAATESITTPHEAVPGKGLTLRVGKAGRQVVVRADQAGDLYLEFDD